MSEPEGFRPFKSMLPSPVKSCFPETRSSADSHQHKPLPPGPFHCGRMRLLRSAAFELMVRPPKGGSDGHPAAGYAII